MVNRLFVSPVFLAAGFLVAAAPARADVVYMVDGETLRGLVVEEHKDRVFLSTEEGEQVLFRAGIDEIFYDEAERNYLYLGHQALEEGEFGLAQEFFRKSLQIDSSFQEALDALRLVEDRRIKEVPPARPIAALREAWGLELEPGEKYARVKEAGEGSLAVRCGINPEDGLVNVWGASLAYLPLEKVAEQLLGPAGTEVQIVIQRRVDLPAELKGKAGWPGIKWDMARAGLTVAAVEENSAAWASGIRPEDRMAAINGRPTRYLPLQEAVRAVRESAAEGVSFIIHRDLKVQRE